MSSLVKILLLSLIVRLISLNQSLWLDEAINVTAARDKGLVDLITQYSLGDFHPPLYHALLHLWIKLFGSSEVIVRLPSVFFGLVTIWATYHISQKLIGSGKIKLFGWWLPFNLIPSILLATSGLHLYYSQEARMYSLAAMGTSLAFLFLTHYLPRLPSLSEVIPHFVSYLSLKKYSVTPNFWFYILSLWIMLTSDYLPWFLLPLFFLYLPLPTIISFLATAPWWPFLFKQLNVGLTAATLYPGWGQVVGAFSLKNLSLIPLKFLIGRVSLDNDISYFLLAGLPLLLVFYLIFLASKGIKKPKSFIVLSWLFIPLVIGTILSLKISLLSYFRFLYLLPAFYLLITFGLSRLSKKSVTKALAVLLLINLVTSASYLFLPQFHRENWRDLATWIKSQDQLDSQVIIPSLAQAAPLNYYLDTVPVRETIVPQTNPEVVYLIRYVQEIFDPQDQQRILLETLGYQRTEIRHFNTVVVWLYQKTDQIYAFNQLKLQK